MEPTDDLVMPTVLMAAFRNLVDAVHEDLAAHGYPGIRAGHGFAMQAVGEGCTSVQLGERLGVTKQAAARTARTLEGLGLLQGRRNEQDRRERVLVPTERGREMLRLSAAAFRAEVRGWRAVVGDRHVDATLATLAAVAAGGRSDTDLSDWAT